VTDADRRIRRLAVWTCVGLSAGLAAIAFWVPTDSFQGLPQRIFYIHVPAAWAAYLAFSVTALASIGFLWKRTRQWDLLALASAEAGLVFTAINLVTGMLWGRPIWNAFWTWDPRLTSTFVMFLVYLGYLAFRSMATDPERGARIAAVIGIMGVIEIPIIHFSVVLWATQHPPPVVMRPGGPDLPVQMLLTLLLMTVVFTMLLSLLVRLRTRVGRLEDHLYRLELRDPEPVR
jgi:heme exporter protein C